LSTWLEVLLCLSSSHCSLWCGSTPVMDI
jgi:hypothetical protein